MAETKETMAALVRYFPRIGGRGQNGPFLVLYSAVLCAEHPMGWFFLAEVSLILRREPHRWIGLN